MNRDDIIRMAREAGCPDPMVFSGCLERFAALVAADEREACAKAVEDTDIEQFTHCMVVHDDGRETLANAAAAIRARGAK